MSENCTVHTFRESGKWYTTDRGTITEAIFRNFSDRRDEFIALNGGQVPRSVESWKGLRDRGDPRRELRLRISSDVGATMTDLYLESHVTIAPVHGEEREAASRVAAEYGFKLAHLVMLKDSGPDVPSQRDSFMTGHSKNVDELADRTRCLLFALRLQGFKVWRYKIESCVIDSRQQGDTWGALDPNAPVQPLIACEGCRP